VIALALLAGSFFYLDSYRTQLLGERFKLARAEAEIAADALDRHDAATQAELLVRIGRQQHLRLRLFDARGALLADSFVLAPPTFTLADPTARPGTRTRRGCSIAGSISSSVRPRSNSIRNRPARARSAGPKCAGRAGPEPRKSICATPPTVLRS
jgi:hypothetical protein